MDVTYETDAAGTVVAVEVAGETLPGVRVGAITATTADDSTVDLEVDGRRLPFRVSRTGGNIDVDSALGHTEFRQ
jgi:hypothetical protein